MVSWPNTLLHGSGAAVGLAFYNVLGAIGGFISPYIVGQLSNSGSYNSSMYVQGAFNLAAALMILGTHLLSPPRACASHESSPAPTCHLSQRSNGCIMLLDM